MKALIFSLPGSESTRNADRIAAAFERAGLDTIICNYWFNEPSDSIRNRQQGSSAFLSITDAGFQSLPRLSSSQYHEVFGDDIDFVDVNAQTYANAHYPRQYFLTKELLNTESPYYQRLRGFAARIDNLLRAILPDITVIQQGSEVLSRIIFSKVLKARIPWLCSETPFFQGYLLLDSAGQHFFHRKNDIELDWNSLSQIALSPEATQRTEQFIAEWKRSKSSKYSQPNNSQESYRIRRFIKESDGPLLFVPMQVPVDANVHHGLGPFESLASFYKQLINSLPQNWRILFKKHPVDLTDSHKLITENSRVLVSVEANIHELIQYASTVAVFSSNVGMEALMYGKPVIVGGKPYYSGKGLTLDVQETGQLYSVIERSLEWRPDTELFQRFLRYILEDYLIKEFDSTALLRRIDKAIQRDSRAITNSKAPFLECDPERALGIIEFVHSYDKLSHCNYMHQEIISQLTIPPFCEIEEIDDLLTNYENQYSAWLSLIESENAARYSFATSVIKRDCSVLDIACGIGYGAYILADQTNAHVDAIDSSRSIIRYAEKNWAHKNINYISASVGGYQSRHIRKLYDVIVSFETLEHILNPNLFLEQLWAILRPGGMMLISTPNRDVYPLINNQFHVEYHNQQSLINMISKLPNLAGIKIYYQDDLLITDQANHRARFLIAAVIKKQQDEQNLSGLFSQFDAILPFHYQHPTRDISNFSDLKKILSRRKNWIKSILF